MKWKRVGSDSSSGLINEPLVDYLERLFDKELSNGYEFKVCIGTDSQKSRGGYKFATAIVIETSEFLGYNKRIGVGGIEHKEPIYSGRGSIVIGNTFWEKMKSSSLKKKHREIEVLNQRMLKEVSTSINIGYKIWPLLDLYGIKLEIHADINSDPKYESNISMGEALGYISGMGWESKIKPDAYASSSAADKLC